MALRSRERTEARHRRRRRPQYARYLETPHRLPGRGARRREMKAIEPAAGGALLRRGRQRHPAAPPRWRPSGRRRRRTWTGWWGPHAARACAAPGGDRGGGLRSPRLCCRPLWPRRPRAGAARVVPHGLSLTGAPPGPSPGHERRPRAGPHEPRAAARCPLTSSALSAHRRPRPQQRRGLVRSDERPPMGDPPLRTSWNLRLTRAAAGVRRPARAARLPQAKEGVRLPSWAPWPPRTAILLRMAATTCTSWAATPRGRRAPGDRAGRAALGQARDVFEAGGDDAAWTSCARGVGREGGTARASLCARRDRGTAAGAACAST